MNDCAGCSAGGYGVGRLLRHLTGKKGWDLAATANAFKQIHSTASVFSGKSTLIFAAVQAGGSCMADYSPGCGLTSSTLSLLHAQHWQHH